MKRIGRSARVTATTGAAAFLAARQARRDAHPAAEGAHGVVAPWYRGGNGQIDHRVRVAAELPKQYP